MLLNRKYRKTLHKLACLFLWASVCLLPVMNLSAQPMQLKDVPNVAGALQAGRMAFDAGRLPQALEHFRRAIALDVNNVEAYYRLGQTYWRMRQARDALQSFAKASELGQDNATLQMSLAGFYEQVRMMGLAVEHYRRVVNIEGESELGKAV